MREKIIEYVLSISFFYILFEFVSVSWTKIRYFNSQGIVSFTVISDNLMRKGKREMCTGMVLSVDMLFSGGILKFWSADLLK